MEVAIVADTHLPRGSRRLPASCLERLRRSDLIVHGGDFVSGAFYEELLALGPPVAAVHGNQDDAALRRRLPAEDSIDVAGARVGLVHDAGPPRGRLARMRRRFPGVAAVIFGHSHIPLHERDGDFQIFNPGSPTERRRAQGHSMGVATVDRGRVVFEHVALD
jgi:uncharacterized protein